MWEYFPRQYNCLKKIIINAIKVIFMFIFSNLGKDYNYKLPIKKHRHSKKKSGVLGFFERISTRFYYWPRASFIALLASTSRN